MHSLGYDLKKFIIIMVLKTASACYASLPPSQPLSTFAEYNDTDCVYREFKPLFKPLGGALADYLNQAGKGLRPFHTVLAWFKAQVPSLVFEPCTTPRSMKDLSCITSVIALCSSDWEPAQLIFDAEHTVDVPKVIKQDILANIVDSHVLNPSSNGGAEEINPSNGGPMDARMASLERSMATLLSRIDTLAPKATSPVPNVDADDDGNAKTGNQARLSTMESALAQLLTRMDDLRGSSSAAHKPANGEEAPILDEQDPALLLAKLLSSSAPPKGKEREASAAPKEDIWHKLVSALQGQQSKSAYAPQDQAMELLEALALRTQEGDAVDPLNQLKQALGATGTSLPSTSHAPQSPLQNLIDTLQAAQGAKLAPPPTTSPDHTLLNQLLSHLLPTHTAERKDKEVAARLTLRSPFLHEWPGEWERLAPTSSPEKILAFQHKITEETVSANKQWQQYQVYFIVSVVGHLLAGDKDRALLALSHRLAFLKKLGDGATVKEAVRFNEILEGGGTRPTTSTRAELESNLYSHRYPREAGDLLKQGDPQLPPPGADPTNTGRGHGIGGGRHRHGRR